MQFFVVAALLAVAAADSAPSYHAPAPAYHAPAPTYHQPAHKSYDAPANYNYEYKVDGYGDYEPHFNAQESRDGYATRGSYSVALPDGRIQTVAYNTADGYSGNVAEVSYSGEAKYPTYHPAPAHKAAAYHPAPVHRPAKY